MTNILNQKFIEEFKTRTQGFQTLNKRVTGAHEKRCEIKTALSDTTRFIQQKVMAKSTSSLIRTQVVIPYTLNDYKFGKAEKKITVNHKGIGTISNAIAGNTGYGMNQTFSDELQAEELLEVLSTPAYRDAIKADLLGQNSYKVLKYFTDVCTTEPELVQLKVIGDKYDNKIEISFEEPQEIVQIEVGYAADSENGAHEVSRKNFRIDKVRIDRSDNIILVQNGFKPDEEEKITLPFGDIETAMVLMQIPDELDKVLKTIEADLDASLAEANRLINDIKDKLCVYAAVAELKE